MYSLHPAWLNYQLNKTLDKLNIETLDTFILTNPMENIMNIYRDHNEQYAALIRAFGFMEQMVQENKIKSYGISSSLAFTLDPYMTAFQIMRPINSFNILQV